MSSVRITRDRARSKDRRRPYTVFVDNQATGEVHRGQILDLPVSPGIHVVRVSVGEDTSDSREWHVTLRDADVVSFRCRSRAKKSAGPIDLYLEDPRDHRVQLVPLPDLLERDLGRKQRVVTRDGQELAVWAHRSGYLRSLDPGPSTAGGDAALLELAVYILVLPVLALVRWVRHRLLFKRGWSVGVVRSRRFLWPKKVRLERFRTEAEARARAAEVIAEFERSPAS